MTPLAMLFMAASWGGVLGLTAWCFHRVLRSERDAKDSDPETRR